MITMKDWVPESERAKFKYFFLSERRRSFKNWPFGNDSTCSAEKMAEAGFYCPAKEDSQGMDLACCFLCGKELDGWNSNDIPWEEHKRHSPTCEFALINKSQRELLVAEVRKINMALMKNTMRVLQTSLNENVCKKMEEIKASPQKDNKITPNKGRKTKHK